MSKRAIESAREDVTHAKSRTALEMFRRITHYVTRYPWFALGTMGCALLSQLFSLAQPWLIQQIVDHALSGKDMQLLTTLVVSLAGAFILRDTLNSLRIRLNNTFEQHVIFDMRRDIYEKLQTLPVQYYDKRATGDIMTRVIDDVNSFERVLIDGIEQGAVAVFSLIGAAYMLFHYNSQLAFIAIIPAPFLFIGALIFTKTAHMRYRVQRRAVSLMNALLLDNLQGIRQIKGFAREEHETKRFSERSEDLRQGTLLVMRAWSLYNPSMSLIAAFGIVLVLFFGGQQVISGDMSVGMLVGVLGYISMFYEPVTRLHGLNQIFQAGRAAGERIFDILDAPSESNDAPHAKPYPGRVKGEIVFEKVCFEYAPGQQVLHEVDFRVKAGQTIALVGPTGAGKSSIMNLIPRFYDFTSGKISIDGVSIQDVTLKSLRQQIGIVSQEPFLFNGNIRENILYGRLDATEEEMIAASKAANVHEFTSRLPDGYDSKVGERGVKLSVGEKQRVSIARALLKDPPILLLDEATASVDTHTEKLIQEALDHLMHDRTSLIIAHRLSTIRSADVILVLERGRIIERGNHDELMRKNGLYARLCRIQHENASIEEAFETLTTH
jgi:ATP-binding cassette, subfamily B, bacterial